MWFDRVHFLHLEIKTHEKTIFPFEDIDKTLCLDLIFSRGSYTSTRYDIQNTKTKQKEINITGRRELFMIQNSVHATIHAELKHTDKSILMFNDRVRDGPSLMKSILQLCSANARSIICQCTEWNLGLCWEQQVKGISPIAVMSNTDNTLSANHSRTHL